MKKISLFLVFLGIFSFGIRYYIDLPFLGWFVDYIWVLTFCIVLYDDYRKYMYLLIPVLMNTGFEIFQLTYKELGFISTGYWPGTYDPMDVLAGIFALLSAWLIIKWYNIYINKKGEL